MNKVITWLKKIRLNQIVTVFFAGILLFVSTACGDSNLLAKTADQVKQEVPDKAVTNTYKGGMNDYEDIDPRRSTTQSKAKAKSLIENAQKNVNTKGIDSPGDYAENFKSGTPLGERTKRLGENIGDSAKNAADDVAEGTKRGIRNIKENTQDAASAVKVNAQDTASSVKGKVNRDIGRTQQALEDSASAVKGKVNRDIGRTQQALDDAADAID